MVEQRILSKIKEWRERASSLDDQRFFLERGRYYSSLSDEEKRRWNEIRDEASNLRGCANEIEGLIK